MQDIAGRVAVITGASRGLGANLARALAREGCRCILFAQGSEVLDVAQEIVQDGGQAVAVQGSVAQEEDVRALAQRALAEYGALDI